MGLNTLKAPLVTHITLHNRCAGVYEGIAANVKGLRWLKGHLGASCSIPATLQSI